MKARKIDLKKYVFIAVVIVGFKYLAPFWTDAPVEKAKEHQPTVTEEIIRQFDAAADWVTAVGVMVAIVIGGMMIRQRHRPVSLLSKKKIRHEIKITEANKTRQI